MMATIDWQNSYANFIMLMRHPPTRFRTASTLQSGMGSSESSASPLDAAAGAAVPRATEAFKQLGNETRLAILLVLWDGYEPFASDSSLTFSELYDRVEVADSGNFPYHLDQLTGHFVEETDAG